MSLASRLYHGQTAIDFVGRWRRWFAISAVAMLVSLVALFVPGLKFGIDFRGGAIFRAQATHPVTTAQVRDAVGPALAKVVQVTTGSPQQVIVQTEVLPQGQVAKVNAALARVTGAEQVSTSFVGSKWGSQISRKAMVALLVFLVVVTIYVSLRMEFKMAVAALVALLHDLLITAGVYALARFEVTPATVIGLLTILGYSLYDTVVVFDKVRENTGALSSMSRITYSDAANRAVNQTVVRSLNTSLTSLLPIGALLFVGAFLLGAETIKDLSLALFVGVATGTYSSIFIATPLVALWKEREPRYAQLRARVARQAAAPAAAAGATKAPAKAAANAGTAASAKAAATKPVGSAKAGTAASAKAPGPAGGRTRPARPSRPAGAAEDGPAPMPALPPDLKPDLEPDSEEEPAVAAGDQEAATKAAEAAVPAAGAPRPPTTPKKPRPASQQRRKGSGGRQPSRPAKRRRR